MVQRRQKRWGESTSNYVVNIKELAGGIGFEGSRGPCICRAFAACNSGKSCLSIWLCFVDIREPKCFDLAQVKLGKNS